MKKKTLSKGKEIERITPIIQRVPTEWKNEGQGVVRVTKWDEFQNGWNLGEEGMIGKINEIIDTLNTLSPSKTNKK